jgi:hypothetical protein
MDYVKTHLKKDAHASIITTAYGDLSDVTYMKT